LQVEKLRRAIEEFMTARRLRPFVILLAVELAGAAVLPVASAAEGAETAAHEATSAPNPLVVDPDLAIWTAVVFFVLLAVLGKFAWPPITKALEEREKRIADHIAAAQSRHEEAKAVLAQHEAKLAAAADEVRGLLEEARRDAEHTKTQIIAEARAAAESEHKRAVREVHQATDVAMKQLAETSAALAVQLAGKVVAEELSPAHQDRLVREAISRLTTATTPSEN
jgi:F-type H+-transporting ATPase subunit b